jgi:hypothetical protein
MPLFIIRFGRYQMVVCTGCESGAPISWPLNYNSEIPKAVSVLSDFQAPPKGLIPLKLNSQIEYNPLLSLHSSHNPSQHK